MTSAKFLWLLRDFVLEYHHAKFGCNWKTNKGETEGGTMFSPAYMVIKDPSLNNTSFLKFGDTIYCKKPSNTFVPICNFDKSISATQCFVETNDIVIDPLPEYFNDNISPCDSNACLTCNS